MGKLSPSQCKHKYDTKLLDANGIGWNDESISVQPNSVILTMGHTRLTIPMSRFTQFAEWYLEEQEVEGEGNEGSGYCNAPVGDTSTR